MQCQYDHRDFESCCLFHSFFREDAAALFPKRNREVCLSAPVFLEYLDVPSKTIYYSLVSISGKDQQCSDLPPKFPTS